MQDQQAEVSVASTASQNLNCQNIFAEIGAEYQVQTRIHASLKSPPAIMHASMNKLNGLFGESQKAFDLGDVDQLHTLFDQIRKFEEPAEVQAYHGQQFQQKVHHMLTGISAGNR